MIGLSTIAAFLVALALGQLAALLSVWYRHAIPRAPWLFRLLLLPPMLTSSSTALALAWMAQTGAEEVAGLDGITLFGIYIIAVTITWWTFNIYAVYFYFAKKRQTRDRERDSARDAGRDEGRDPPRDSARGKARDEWEENDAG